VIWQMRVIANWSEMPARKRHLMFYAALVAVTLAGNAIKNSVATPSTLICRAAAEQFPSLNPPGDSIDSEVQRLGKEFQEAQH
jgi:hypothetical protein